MPPPPTDAHGRVDNRRGPGPPGQSITTPHPGLGPTAVSPGPHWTHAYVIVLTRPTGLEEKLLDVVFYLDSRQSIWSGDTHREQVVIF